jgi:EpsD family peptidyl-prolyl cis-trans isomerase
MKNSLETLVSSCRAAAMFAACGIILIGCSKKSGEEAAVSGQVVAHVGNQVVTTQELDNEFRLANVAADKQKDPQTIKRILAELVTRKYLFGQAVDSKLDREPGVLLEILRSREQVLANAFLTRAAANKASRITKADLERYVANNPGKFAKRQLMAVEQIAFPIGPNVQAVVDSTKDARTLDEVDQQLSSMGVPHGRSMSNLTSTEIPDDLLKKMQTNNADELFFLRAGQNGLFLKVQSEQSRPLEGEAATNVARQLMRADLLKAELGMASVSANMEAKYEGFYSTIMSNQNSSGKN